MCFKIIKTTNQIIILTLPLAIEKLTLCLKMSRVRSIPCHSSGQLMTIGVFCLHSESHLSHLVMASGRPQFAFPQRPHGSDAQDLLAPFRPVNSVEGALGCPGYVEQARPMTLNDKPWHVLPIESRTLFLMIPQLSHTIGSFANNIPCDLMYFDKRSVLTRSLFTCCYFISNLEFAIA